jgi:hypothetical protein
MVSVMARPLDEIAAIEQRLKDVAVGSQGQPKLFCAAVKQLFDVDIPQNEWNVLPAYDLEKEFNLYGLAKFIHQRKEAEKEVQRIHASLKEITRER